MESKATQMSPETPPIAAEYQTEVCSSCKVASDRSNPASNGDDMAGNESGWDNITEARTDRTGANIEEQVRLILPYSVILLLAVVGNGLVIVTLAINKRMRTVTNVFLLNLAISDLLLGVFCMPFTLPGVLLRRFIFGEAMCRLIPYLQAVSVSVSAWTLVAMSIERYYAICHPLKSREWQTTSHAYRMIGVVWAASLLCMLPIAILSQLQRLRNTDKYKCRENWPSEISEKIFNILLDVLLLVVPLLIMTVTYSFIAGTLWKTIQPIEGVNKDKSNVNESSNKQHPNLYQKTSNHTIGGCSVHEDSLSSSLSSRNSNKPKSKRKETCFSSKGIRASNFDRSLAQKKRVVKMLFVVVLEFFICWTPLYVINTASLYDPWAIYAGLGYYGISFFQLLAYTSSCCNPITYCFMNSKFRQSFIKLFGCKRSVRRQRSGDDLNTNYKTTITNPNYCDLLGSKLSKNSSTKTIVNVEKR